MSYLIYFQPSSESSRPQYPGAGQSTLGLLGLREQSAITIARLIFSTTQFSSIVLTYESARNSQSWDLPSSDWDHHKCGV